MTDTQMEQYSYLSQVAEVVPDEPITESTTMPEEDTTESTTESTTEATGDDENQMENVEGDIPNTGRSASKFTTAVAVFVGSAIATVFVVKKKEE